MSELNDVTLDGVIYTPVDADDDESSCKGCVCEQYSSFNERLCIQLQENKNPFQSSCLGIVWKKKEGVTLSDYTNDYIKSIQEKYPEEIEQPKYPHYFKDVSNVNKIDIYKVLDLWQVTHPCLQHAAKKILVAGNRGHKDIQKDIQEAIDSLERFKEMVKEDTQ